MGVEHLFVVGLFVFWGWGVTERQQTETKILLLLKVSEVFSRICVKWQPAFDGFCAQFYSGLECAM